MSETISMPKLGFDMQEGTLVRWVKNEGENVNKGDVLAEIETDKATVEVESSASGVVRKLLVEAGSVVPIGNPIAIVGSPDEKIDEVPEGKVTEPKAEMKTEEQVGPELKTEPETPKEDGAKKKSEVKAEQKPVPSGQAQSAVTPAPSGQDVASHAEQQEGPVKASPL